MSVTLWPGVTKRYEGVGGCQIYGKKRYLTLEMAPKLCCQNLMPNGFINATVVSCRWWGTFCNNAGCLFYF